jgi:hypothetical protein
MLKKFHDIADRWHLNDTRAGSHAQTEHLRSLEGTENRFPGYPTSHLDWARQRLREVGLEPDPNYGNYSYGTRWLREEVPHDVMEWLASLPDTDRRG